MIDLPLKYPKKKKKREEQFSTHDALEGIKKARTKSKGCIELIKQVNYDSLKNLKNKIPQSISINVKKYVSDKETLFATPSHVDKS